MDLAVLLRRMVEENASDLILKVGTPPALRIDGSVRITEDDPVTEEFSRSALEQMLQPVQLKRFEQRGEADFSYESDGNRFRVNAFRQRGHIGLVFRHIPQATADFEQLHLPAAQLEKLSSLKRGLVLVTGTAGSGKSTTLAAMIKYMNDHFHRHIITIEDPIEFVYEDNLCVIEQREVGSDTEDFLSALRHCLRQSPDVILIGEMRDKETVEAAISAAETGHLVLSTLHTVNAMQTVERIINFFPPHQHALIRLQISLILEGVVSQRLLASAQGGRVPAVEIMLATPTIRDLLAEGKTRDLYSALKDGREYFGTCTFNQSLKELVDMELITMEQALQHADDPDELKLEFRGFRQESRSGDFEPKLKKKRF